MKKLQISNCIIYKNKIEYNEEFQLNIDFALEKIAKHKACGIDEISAFLFKQINDILKRKFKDSFSRFLLENQVQKYFIEVKLILLSKDGSEFQTINKIKPINFLPSITKVFELSIINEINIVTDHKYFSTQQRGFIKNKSTVNNIDDLLKFGLKIQSTKLQRKKEQAAYVFFDLKRAYDTVQRDILLERMKIFNIPLKIVLAVKNMLENFRLKYIS